MMFRCNKADLLPAITAAARAINTDMGGGNDHAALCLRLETKKGKLHVLGWSPSIAIRSAIDVESEASVVASVGAGLLCDVVAQIQTTRSDAVSAVIDGRRLVLRGDGAEYKLALAENVERKLKTPDPASAFVVDAADLKLLLRRVLSASGSASADRALLTVKDGVLTASATDTVRMAVAKLPVHTDQQTHFVAPLRSIAELARTLPDTGEVTVTRDAGQMAFAFGHIVFTTTCTDGSVPDHTRVLPTQTSFSVTLDRAALTEALRGVSPVARGNNNKVTLSITSEATTMQLVCADDTTASGAEREVPVTVEGDCDLTLTFNARYLLDPLSVADADKVLLRVSSPQSPALMTPADDESGRFLYLLMPINL